LARRPIPGAEALSIRLQPIDRDTARVLLDSIGGGATLLLMGGGLRAATAGFSLPHSLRRAMVIGGHVPR
jgi:hypothetical protein